MKPDKRVYVIIRNVHDGRSRCLTVLDTDCDELHGIVRGLLKPQTPKPERRKRTSAT